ncbi:hypothetical protein V1512DRAFT_267489 [Lipomyces arxii]|uniref:uncharacterized protein n=1 Tax=Lipomyces arxii TaxID=56418 RepID=UPI0034CDA0B8
MQTALAAQRSVLVNKLIWTSVVHVRTFATKNPDDKTPKKVSDEKRSKIAYNLRRIVKSDINVSSKVQGLLAMLFKQHDTAEDTLSRKTQFLRPREVSNAIDENQMFDPIPTIMHDLEAADGDGRPRRLFQTEEFKPSRNLFFMIDIPSMIKSDFVRLQTKGRVDFEYYTKRNDNLVRKSGYYLQFSSTESALEYRESIAGSYIFGSPAGQYIRYASDEEVDKQIKSYSEHGISSNQTAVMIYSIPRAAKIAQIREKIGYTHGEDLQVFTSAQGQKRCLIKTRSRDEALKLKLALHGKPWTDRVPMFTDLIP